MYLTELCITNSPIFLSTERVTPQFTKLIKMTVTMDPSCEGMKGGKAEGGGTCSSPARRRTAKERAVEQRA